MNAYSTLFCWGLDDVSDLVFRVCLHSIKCLKTAFSFLNLLQSKIVTYFWQDMRNLRLAYKQEEQNRLEIFENLVTRAFPVSNGLVSLKMERRLSLALLFWENGGEEIQRQNNKLWSVDSQNLLQGEQATLTLCVFCINSSNTAVSCYWWSYFMHNPWELGLPNVAD